MSDASQIQDPKHRYEYMLAGNAKVTLVSKKSGARFTYQIRRKDLEDKRFLHFVSLLRGPDNQADYMFLGTIFGGEQYRHSKKSPIGPDAPGAKAFEWAWNNLASQDMEVWHSGACSRCGRELTDPASIARGLGPVCAEKGMGA
jgi:hypothetical protein